MIGMVLLAPVWGCAGYWVGRRGELARLGRWLGLHA